MDLLHFKNKRLKYNYVEFQIARVAATKVTKFILAKNAILWREIVNCNTYRLSNNS